MSTEIKTWLKESPFAGAHTGWLDRLVRRFWWPALWRRVSEQQETIRRNCLEWADDHSHLQQLCRDVGCTEHEVEGDSYGVPGISELADTLRKRIPPNGSNNTRSVGVGDANTKKQQ
jgi:hypothetical protein